MQRYNFTAKQQRNWEKKNSPKFVLADWPQAGFAIAISRNNSSNNDVFFVTVS